MKLLSGLEIEDPPPRSSIAYKKWFIKHQYKLAEHNRIVEARKQKIKKMEERVKLPEITRNRMKKAQEKRNRRKEKVKESYILDLDNIPIEDFVLLSDD